MGAVCGYTILKSLYYFCNHSSLSENPLGVSGYQALESAARAGILANLKRLLLGKTLTEDADTNGALLTTLTQAVFSHCRKFSRLSLYRNNMQHKH